MKYQALFILTPDTMKSAPLSAGWSQLKILSVCILQWNQRRYYYDDKKSDGKSKKRNGSTSSRLEEDDVDEHFKILTEKHGDVYSVPQRRLWARRIHGNTHDSYDTPPALPMFEPPPKRPKKESLAESITNAAVAITKAVNPST